MARPTKLREFKRFSLRIPGDVLKAAKHAAVDADLSTNDWIRQRLMRKRTVKAYHLVESQPPIAEHDRRYPLRLTPKELRLLRSLAKVYSCSQNTFLVACVRRDLDGAK